MSMTGKKSRKLFRKIQNSFIKLKANPSSVENELQGNTVSLLPIQYFQEAI